MEQVLILFFPFIIGALVFFGNQFSWKSGIKQGKRAMIIEMHNELIQLGFIETADPTLIPVAFTRVINRNFPQFHKGKDIKFSKQDEKWLKEVLGGLEK